MNRLKKLGLPLLFILFCSGCKDCQPDILNPTGPSGPSGPSDPSTVRQIWSPYVGVHPYGACESQKPYLAKLIRAGMLKGVRMEGLENPGIQQCASWLSSQGVEVLGLIDQKNYLRDPDFNRLFGSWVQQNPSVRVWEIGNEVQGSTDGRGAMSIQEYMPIFKSLFYYAKANHPQVWVAPQSDGLGEMLDNGLDQIIRDGLPIVTVHYYDYKKTISLESLQEQIARVPGTVQVWITETGDNSWPTQVSYVQTNYPRYQGTLRAIRIFWYVFSECPENGGDFSLIKGLPGQCAAEPTQSPLFSALTGGVQ